ncbi:MAG: hypothetical protein D6757_04550 [Alphaproteobacteria bacterium]|nr:MAG: hypothetical protein D6757_04550 [Alphaproteobacteria bacterium]
MLLFTIGLLAVLGLLSVSGGWGAWGLLGFGTIGLLALYFRRLTVSVSGKGVRIEVAEVRKAGDLPGYDDVKDDIKEDDGEAP